MPKFTYGPSDYTVTYSAREVAAWNDRWPCSTLSGRQTFVFDRGSGDLTDRTGRGDGEEADALSHDAQRWAHSVAGAIVPADHIR